jgi:hypothetical protein
MIKRIVESKYVRLFIALALVGTSGYEVIEGLDEWEIGAHHGVFIYAIIPLLKSLTEIFEAAELIGPDKVEKQDNGIF